MSFRLTFVFTACALALTACATSYGGFGLLGGMRADWIDDDSLKVKATGNGFTSPQETSEMFLLWAAEKGAEKGYTHFTMEDFSGKELRRGGSKGYTEKTDLKGVAEMYSSLPDAEAGVEVFVIEKIITELAPKYKKEDS